METLERLVVVLRDAPDWDVYDYTAALEDFQKKRHTYKIPERPRAPKRKLVEALFQSHSSTCFVLKFSASKNLHLMWKRVYHTRPLYNGRLIFSVSPAVGLARTSHRAELGIWDQSLF
jgi:hypothetical protein